MCEKDAASYYFILADLANLIAVFGPVDVLGDLDKFYPDTYQTIVDVLSYKEKILPKQTASLLKGCST